MTWNGILIRTDHWAKPVPSSNFDHSAWLDGHEESGRVGFGASHDIAVADLIQQLYEMDV